MSQRNDRDSHQPAEAAGDPVEAYARLISGLVHDLRTPLTAIVGAASSLQSYADRFDAATRARLLQSIVEEADHLDRLLANMSVLARARSGRLAPDKQPARALELLNGVVASMRQRHEAADIRVAAGSAETAIAADISLMHGALLNVLDVAARFALSDFTIELSARAQADHLHLAFTVPVAPAMRAKLDDLLAAYAAGRSTDAVRASDFILLEAAREVVHSHGGWLSVEAANEPDRLHVVVALPT